MPKATLTFTLPEERSEYRLAVNGTDYHSVLWDLDQYLRSRIKYEELPEPIEGALQAVRDKLYSLMGDNDVQFEP